MSLLPRRFLHLKRSLKTGIPVLAAVAAAFLAGSLYSLYTLEQKFPTPLSAAQDDLAQIQIILEHLDHGDLAALRDQLRRQSNALVLAVDLLSQAARTPEQQRKTADLLVRVARHRKVWGKGKAEAVQGRVWEQEVEAKADEVLRRYLEAAE